MVFFTAWHGSVSWILHVKMSHMTDDTWVKRPEIEQSTEGPELEKTWELEETKVPEDVWRDWRWPEEARQEGIESGNESDEESIHEQFFIQLRIWSKRANLVFYDSISWIFTKAYSLDWISIEAMEPLLKEMNKAGMKLDFDPSMHNQESIGRYQFEGPVILSSAMQKLIETKLSPSILDYERKHRLGKGATSNVWLCIQFSDKSEYALKANRLDDDIQIKEEPREVTVLSNLRNEYIVKFSQAWIESGVAIEYEETSDGSIVSADESMVLEGCDYLFILMEHCPGTLENYLSPPHNFDVQKSFQYFEEITLGLKYIHHQGVIHRDMKPGNVFLGQDGVAKIGDFGHSCFRPNDCPTFRATPNLGTRVYAAPELRAGINVSEKVDIYSLGVIYFWLFSDYGTVSQRNWQYDNFKGNSSQENWENICWHGDSEICAQLITQDPLGRPRADDILERLNKSTILSQKIEESIKNDLKIIQDEGGSLRLESMEETWEQEKKKYQVKLEGLNPPEEESPLAVLSSRSSVSKERQELLSLVSKEVDHMVQEFEEINVVGAQNDDRLRFCDRDHEELAAAGKEGERPH